MLRRLLQGSSVGRAGGGGALGLGFRQGTLCRQRRRRARRAGAAWPQGAAVSACTASPSQDGEIGEGVVAPARGDRALHARPRHVPASRAGGWGRLSAVAGGASPAAAHTVEPGGSSGSGNRSQVGEAPPGEVLRERAVQPRVQPNVKVDKVERRVALHPGRREERPRQIVGAEIGRGRKLRQRGRGEGSEARGGSGARAHALPPAAPARAGAAVPCCAVRTVMKAQASGSVPVRQFLVSCRARGCKSVLLARSLPSGSRAWQAHGGTWGSRLRCAGFAQRSLAWHIASVGIAVQQGGGGAPTSSVRNERSALKMSEGRVEDRRLWFKSLHREHGAQRNGRISAGRQAPGGMHCRCRVVQHGGRP